MEQLISAISEIGAIVGDGCDTMVPGAIAAWSSSEDVDRYLITVHHNGDKIERVVCEPESDAEWVKTYRIIGYCAYHGISWDAP